MKLKHADIIVAWVQLHFLGAYEREEDAARAYDIAVRKHLGRDAATNLAPRAGRPPRPIAGQVSHLSA